MLQSSVKEADSFQKKTENKRQMPFPLDDIWDGKGETKV